MLYRKSACGATSLLGLTGHIRKSFTAAEADEIPREYMPPRDVAQGVVREMNAPMRAGSDVIVACANYLHVLGFIALIPSHNLQPLTKDNLIEMEILQGPERVQLHPIGALPAAVTIKVCVDFWHHLGARCDKAERRPSATLRHWRSACDNGLIAALAGWACSLPPSIHTAW